jgi:hypothetical protein
MAIFAATNHTIVLGSTDITTWVSSVEVNLEANVLGVTAFGSTWESSIGGLKRGTVTITVNQDFVATGFDSIVMSGIGLGATSTFKVYPHNSSVGTTNPLYSGAILISQYSPVNAKVGDLAVVSVSWPTTGTFARTVA